MFVDVAKGHRNTLLEAEREFFAKVVPIATYISSQTAGKAQWIRNMRDPVGILPSLMIASILHNSQFGNHPVAQKRYGSKPSNNLSLLEAGKYYHGSQVEYRGKDYRAYKDWQQYSIDVSDYIAMSGTFDELLREEDLAKQIMIYSLTQRSPNAYCARIKDMIELYSLQEFDRWPERKKDQL
jgi:flagellum-specific peptidoglycan hydrolase FlgJ